MNSLLVFEKPSAKLSMTVIVSQTIQSLPIREGSLLALFN